jgi:hypothetical protein
VLLKLGLFHWNFQVLLSGRENLNIRKIKTSYLHVGGFEVPLGGFEGTILRITQSADFEWRPNPLFLRSSLAGRPPTHFISLFSVTKILVNRDIHILTQLISLQKK